MEIQRMDLLEKSLVRNREDSPEGTSRKVALYAGWMEHDNTTWNGDKSQFC